MTMQFKEGWQTRAWPCARSMLPLQGGPGGARVRWAMMFLILAKLQLV